MRLTSEPDARRSQLLSFLDAIPVPAAVALSSEARDVHINAAFGQILGVDPRLYADFTVSRGRPLPFRFEIDGKALTYDEAPLVRAARGETIEATRLDVHLHDGSRRQLLGWAAPLLDARGGSDGAICVFQDIGIAPERFEAEGGRPAQVASEQQFRLMADAMPQLLWTTLPDGYLNWANQRWYEYTGLSSDETLGWGWRCAYHPDDLPEASRRLLSALDTGELYEMEARLRARGGGFRWFLIRATPMRDALGRISKWHGSHTDIDDVRRAQRTLQVFAHLGEALSESLGLQATLDAVMQAIVPEYADWAFINLTDDNGDLRVAATYHTDPRKSEILQSCVGEIYSRSKTPVGSPETLRTREPLLYATATYEDAERVVEAGVLEPLWEVGFKSVLVVPLLVGSDGRGTLNVAMYESNRAFEASDVPTFKELARRFAPAIANAELYERERRVARSFQEAALPASLPTAPGYAFDAIYEAGRAEALVGGDWFDAFRLIDGRIVVSIGDVAGSGLLAAVTMASVRQSIRGVAQVHADPALMLEAADRALRSESPERYVTAFVGVLDPIVGSMSFASAGHPPPLYCDSEGHISELVARGLPLGLRELDGGQTNAVSLEPGSFLAFYTDGLTESTHDMLEGEARLREALADPAVTGARSPATAIYDAVLRGVSRDDVAILTISVREPADVARWAFDPKDARATHGALRETTRALSARGYPADLMPAAELIMAELIGNLVQYAPQPAEIALEWDASHPVVHILDRGPGFQFVAKLPMDPYSESGRGLFLIASLSDDFHVLRRTDGGSHARVVLRLK